MNRNKYIDFLKGVLIFLVVVGHALQYTVHGGTGFYGDPAFQLIYMFHMPLFMAISGYLSRRGINNNAPIRTIKYKFYAYIIPAITWGAIQCIAVTCTFGKLSDITKPGQLLSEMAEPFWFLWALFGAISLTVFARQAGRHFPIAYFISFFAVLILPDKKVLPYFKYTYPFFQIGYLTSLHGIPPVFLKHKAAIFTAACAASVICFFLWQQETYIYNSKMRLSFINMKDISVRYISGTVLSIAALYTLFAVNNKIPKKTAWLFEIWGRESIYIYIIQSFVFTANAYILHWVPTLKTTLLQGWAVAAFCGLAVCWFCQLAGTQMARNALIGRLLFGKTKNTPNQPTAVSTAS